jgi:twitching motility protein PilT
MKKPLHTAPSQRNLSDWLIRLEMIVRDALERGVSDIIFKAGQPPTFRICGDLVFSAFPRMQADDVMHLVEAMTTEEQKNVLARKLELDMGYDVSGLTRLRVNVFFQRGQVSSVMRIISTNIRRFEDLSLPHVIRDLAMRPRGLFLVTGATGSGKSTTLAAIIDYINSSRDCHIITIEDPIEFLFQNKRALINQRDIGYDTRSFSAALKYSLRQDPDVIMVGEMRDLETIALAITAAETGHMVLSTLHTTGAVSTIDRIIGVFPHGQQSQIRLQLSVNLLAVLSQVLLKKADGSGRVGGFELMVATPAIRNLIREGKNQQIQSLIHTGMKHEMKTLDQTLAGLVISGAVSMEEALPRSQDPPTFMHMVEVGSCSSSSEKKE